ncbi:hypothetical protein N7509_004410 [Penicillium cosmopolitanum]|uniref:PEBP-like protein n=1 Tax=Penicillium cosmopolitanum TaxID=1131564 RepID=A0A9W9W6S1_9EURO|nr:uncharacterized protein N7509_004410 [Penicillium cosmopolitanum]KAJ5404539.1 hypothetical protein N7509_004410 [Penicillium cosmopolitanum]
MPSGQRVFLRYPEGEWIAPGSILDISGTKYIPEISSYGLCCQKHYIMLSLDIDVVMPNTGTQTVVLHWYQPHLAFNCTNGNQDEDTSRRLIPDNNINSTTDYLAPYIAPQPPPNSHHRYVFLLFAQPPDYRFPKCFSHIPPKTPDARAGFDLRQFMHAAGLGPPVAVNYFYGRNQASDHNSPPPSSSVTTTSFRSVTCTTVPTGFCRQM